MNTINYFEMVFNPPVRKLAPPVHKLAPPVHKLAPCCSLDDFLAAQNRLKNVVRNTPIVEASLLPHTENQRIYLKLESMQETGAFKIRGAYNKLASLSAEERARGVIASSSGNHGQGVARSAQILKCKATIVCPVSTPDIKISNIQGFGAEVVVHGEYFEKAQERAFEIKKNKNLTFIPPFNDKMIIAGQGTIGLEIIDSLPDCDCIVVPVGGGGLICGISMAAKFLRPSIKVIGIQSARSPASCYAFHNLPKPEIIDSSTLADGIRVVEPGAFTFPYIREYVDEMLTVEEEEIENAILFGFNKQHIVAEGAGATTMASVLSGKLQRVLDEHGWSKTIQKICLVISGGNIDQGKMMQLFDNQRKRQVEGLRKLQKKEDYMMM